MNISTSPPSVLTIEADDTLNPMPEKHIDFVNEPSNDVESIPTSVVPPHIPPTVSIPVFKLPPLYTTFTVLTFIPDSHCSLLPPDIMFISCPLN